MSATEIEAKDLLGIARRTLTDAGVLDVKELKVTGYKKIFNEWHVNVSYSAGIMPRVALLAIDATTGKVTQFKEGYSWTT
jgi:hypothetical protein